MKFLHLILITATLLPINVFADYWTQKADFGGINRADATGFAIGTKGYIGTGFTTTYSQDWWEYDQATNTWVQKANYGGSGIVEAAAFSVGSKGYILPAPIGNDLWQYDSQLDTWTQMAVFPGSARQAAVAFSIDTKGYITTGLSSTLGGSLNDLWEYDIPSNMWTQKSDLTGPARHYATGFAIGTKGYVGTGISTATSYLNDFWAWDRITDTWSQQASFPGAARVEASGFALNGMGYIGMGSANGNYYTDFYQYNPNTNTWAQKADFLGGPREEATQFAIGSFGYVGTGYAGITAGVMKKDFWEYHPEDSTTSLQDLNSASMNLKVYPNPFSTETQISLDLIPTGQEINLQIFDMMGKIVYSQSVSKKTTIIQRGNLADGVYQMYLTAQGKVIGEEKIIVSGKSNY